MLSLNEYLIIYQIEEDLKFLNEDQIDEGKIKDGLKKAWGWIKGKFKKKKKEDSDNSSSSSNYSSHSSSDIDDENKNDKNQEKQEKPLEKFTYKICKYDEVESKIYKNNELKKGKAIINKGYDNKIRIALAEDNNEKAVGCLFFITHDKYERPTEFSEYKDFDHIFSMQVDKSYFNKGISEVLLKTILKEITSLSGFKGLTLDIKEYNTKKKLYEKWFEVKKVENNEIAVYKR